MARALHHSAITSRTLHEIDELNDASALFGRIWGTSMADAQVPGELLRALVHAGNYAAGAFDDEEGTLVGAVVGFLGKDDDGVYLHSHILGVDPDHRGHNIGYALKQHQRSWALDQGLSKITWTFDPLVRRNAYFNIQKLGARAASYHERFYGDMSDEINAGDESDRVLVRWDLLDGRAVAASTGALPEADASGDVLLVSTPDDIVALRKSDPQRSTQWRRTVRSELGGGLADGYEVTGFTRSGSYVLSKHG